MFSGDDCAKFKKDYVPFPNYMPVIFKNYNNSWQMGKIKRKATEIR